ncbi:hypothetical protein ACTA71_006848 [Dictyostelium dimigraforme]
MSWNDHFITSRGRSNNAISARLTWPNYKQDAQRLWMINQFMDAVENNNINSAVHKSWNYQLTSRRITSNFLRENLPEWNKISFRKASFNSFIAIKNNKNTPLTRMVQRNKSHGPYNSKN